MIKDTLLTLLGFESSQLIQLDKELLHNEKGRFMWERTEITHKKLLHLLKTLVNGQSKYTNSNLPRPTFDLLLSQKRGSNS